MSAEGPPARPDKRSERSKGLPMAYYRQAGDAR
jgi:hypothetical protein